MNYFVEAHVRDGYEFVLPPHVLTFAAGYTAGQFPKFADEVFALEEGEQGPARFLLPTAETALVNLHRDETLPEMELPKRYVAYTPCYRKEAATARPSGKPRAGTSSTRSNCSSSPTPTLRTPRMKNSSVRPRRWCRSWICTIGSHGLRPGDTSAAMAKTYDVEVWLPSVGAYVEVSSVSNARDYQARRGNIRYRPRQGKSAVTCTR